MRNSPERRESRRKEMIDNLEEVVEEMRHVTPLQVSIRIIAEALIFILEGQCPKKH